MTEFTSRYVDAGGVETHYIEQGEGQPVVLIHGGGAGADGWCNWYRTIPVLAPHCRVIAIDMLGFGRTGKPGGNFEYSQDARNTHLVSVLEALDLKGATLVGNSMGGATAIGAAVHRPDLVGKLVLMGSAGLVTHLSPAIQSVLHYDFTREGMVRIMEGLTSDGFVVEDHIVDYRVKMAAEEDTRRAYSATMKWVRDAGGLYYDESFVASVNVPSLIVNGKDDKVVSVDYAMNFLRLIPRSWGYFIPKCGHWAMLEHVEDFAFTTLNFVQHVH